MGRLCSHPVQSKVAWASKVCCLVGAVFKTARTGCARCVKWHVKQDGTGQGYPSLCNGSIFLAH